MPRKPPNPLQKLVRGLIRDLINETIYQTVEPPKIVKIQHKATAKPKGQDKRSRYISSSIRVSVLHRDSYKCVFCGRNARQIQLEVDHIKPFSQGGSNLAENLQTLCIDCNRGKGNRHLK